ncbi:hypothetical protein EWM64_g7507 [Hericium alpestre]|uniref:Polyketide synthase phosphopantetheine-binding domain-containing protein n=1 Tax=Hericium alpestre TaxID=135208 RepID=A0A4Y9ZNR0_9AGAM|nr:hypothetical protein EWM64_g7507 [Hericium alpestre]
MSSAPLSPPPATQALTSSTFRAPPLDKSLTIPELCDWHFVHSPNHTLFSYADPNGTVKDIHWAEAVRAIRRGALFARIKLGSDAGQSGQAAADKPVIGVFATTDSITYYTTVLGLVYAGFVPFLISTRNSAVAVADLLSKTGVSRLLIGVEDSLHEVVDEAMKLLKEQGNVMASVPQVAAPLFGDLYTQDDGEVPAKAAAHSVDSPFVILHSSGSTAFPKPITWTHAWAIQLARTPYYGQRDLTGMRFGSHSVLFFHAMGTALLTWTLSVGVVLTVFEPQSPAHQSTTDSVFAGYLATKVDLPFTVPSMVESWSQNEEYVKHMAGFVGVMAGGGPLNQKVGDYLASKGVDFMHLYGWHVHSYHQNPIRFLTYSLDPTGKDWQYMRINSFYNVAWIPDDEGRQELIIKDGPLITPSVFNSTHDGEPVYATSDLFEPHPTKAGLWRIFGRTDDQIIHSNGEKTNPGPLEHMLNLDPHVRASLMFGRGRFSAGVLVEPAAGYEIDVSDADKVSAFRNLIWPTVEKMNAYAPQHSRVFKEMILVASLKKPFTFTAKHTPRRQAVLKEYDEEIKQIYASIEESAQTDIEAPPAWDIARTAKFVRTVVQKVLEREVSDHEDIFQLGCDSLKATWIRNTILRVLRESTDVQAQKIPGDFIYQHPYVSSLASFLSSLVLGKSEATQSNRAADMVAMVEKYTQNIPQHVPSLPQPQKDTILLTGSTGGLGANILAHLVADPAVARIYAFNRKSSKQSLHDRQVEALRSRGLDTSLASSEKVVLVEADVSQENLGISAELRDELRSSLTHIIHNAWPVDFKLSLGSFEPSIHGLRNLVDLALSSLLPTPSCVAFTGSIGIFQGALERKPVYEVPVQAQTVAAAGYPESKWVGERILEIISEKTTLRAVNIRVGQLSGGVNGAWTTTEWFPSLVRSSVYLGAVPDCPGEVSWVPAELAAAAVSEMRNSPFRTVHLVHPRPVTWSDVAKSWGKALNIPVIPYTEWLARLDKSAESVSPFTDTNDFRVNPALRLLDWYHSAWSDTAVYTTEAMGFPKLLTDNAVKSSPSLAAKDVHRIGERDVFQWVDYWKSVGFIPA